MNSKERHRNSAGEVVTTLREQNRTWRHQNLLMAWQTEVQTLQQMAMQPGLDPVVAKDLRDRVIQILGTPPMYLMSHQPWSKEVAAKHRIACSLGV